MNSLRRILCISCVMFLTMSGCEKNTEISSKSLSIFEVDNKIIYSSDNERIADVLAKYDFCKAEDTKLLDAYIIALVETEKPFPALFVSDSCPYHIREYASARYKSLNGSYVSQFDQFMDNKGDIFNTCWASASMLDNSLYMGDYLQYEDYLNTLLSVNDTYKAGVLPDAKECSLLKLIPFYKGFELLISGKFDKLKVLFDENRSNKYLQYEMSILEVDFLLIENEFDKAKALIDSLLDKYPENEDVMLQKAELLWLLNGDKADKKYLEGILDKHPDYWSVQLNYAALLVREGNTEDGLELLKKVAMKRPFDYYANLLYVEYLIGLQKLESEKDIVKKILERKEYMRSPYYHTVLAKLYYYLGDNEKMNKHIEFAKRLNSHADYIYWFNYEVLESTEVYDEADYMLYKYLKYRPNDIEALYEKYKLKVKLNKQEEADKIKEKILKSKRKVPGNYFKEAI